MNVAIPPTAQAITALWLEGLLTAQSFDGGLTKVGHVEIEPAVKWNQAETAFLHVTYEKNPADLPTRFFVKLRENPDPLSDIFPGEYHFYRDTHQVNVPIAPCIAVVADDASGATCILLEDLRDTHVAAEWPLPPSLDNCRGALASLAKIHAHWRKPASPDLEARETLLGAHVAEMLPAFLNHLGDRLPKDRSDLLVAACQRAPELKAAFYRSDQLVTRVHGDTHFWNVLYPKSPAGGEALFVDWEDWRVDFAGTDLALSMAMHWYPDRRARHERDLLQHYLSHLNANVTEPVLWDDLWREYRLGLVCNAPIPIFQQAVGNAHASWWSLLERWFLAFEDLDCDEFL